ncbi:MAG: HTH-type transcriptional regulator UlaR [Enterobacteriaceae bacterium]
MTEPQRHNAIVELLQQQSQLSVADMVKAFAVSPATIRRDIIKLDRAGRLKKVRNGAEIPEKTSNVWTPLNIHQTQNLDEKRRIARRAAMLCSPGESVVINCGSTAFLLGREICGKEVQVITNYLSLANYLIEHGHESVVIMGGQYQRDRGITLFPQESYADLFAGNWMFTSGHGLTKEGLYKTDVITALVEQKMINNVGKLVVLVDSSKIGECSGMLFSRTEQIDIVITGTQSDTRVLQELTDKGVQVITV